MVLRNAQGSPSLLPGLVRLSGAMGGLRGLSWRILKLGDCSCRVSRKFVRRDQIEFNRRGIVTNIDVVL